MASQASGAQTQKSVTHHMQESPSRQSNLLFGPTVVEPLRKKCRIRHSQLYLRKGQGRKVSTMEALVRIGDLVAIMICAEYMKRFEGRDIVFQLMEESHKLLKADILFRDTIDAIVTTEGPGYGLEDLESPEIYDPGPLWTASTYYHERYGAQVLPRLTFDPDQYQGPTMNWGQYAIFHPLFDPPYNQPRGMSVAFVNEFCDKLVAALGDRAVVITDKPEQIHSRIRTITTENLYDLAFLIGRSKVYLGGDTGFTHLAAAGRVKHLFALYGENYSRDFPTACTELCFSDLLHPFTAVGKYWGTGSDTRPKCDPAETVMYFHLLKGNGLSAADMDIIARQIQVILGE